MLCSDDMQQHTVPECRTNDNIKPGLQLADDMQQYTVRKCTSNSNNDSTMHDADDVLVFGV